jgi:hypothetical protein
VRNREIAVTAWGESPIPLEEWGKSPIPLEKRAAYKRRTLVCQIKER